jgi:hypothetical protein
VPLVRPFAVTALAAALLSVASVAPASAQQAPDARIDAIRYATIRAFPLSGLVMGAPRDERIDIAMVIWLIRAGDRVVLFDTGFHRERWMEAFDIADFIPPDSAVRLAGVEPGDVTDVIISHAHWDHMGGIDRFPNARLHIQREEYAYYTGAAWQEGGRSGGIDEADIVELVRRNMAGRVNLVDGDDVEILPGIRVYTGARHTYASQYIRVDGPPADPVLLRWLGAHEVLHEVVPAPSHHVVVVRAEAVPCVGEDDEVEVAVGLDERVDDQVRVVRRDVVVHGAVGEEQLAPRLPATSWLACAS